MHKQTTEEYIFQVFSDLLEQYNFDDITISMITSAAGISRTTFYRHFPDIYAIVCWPYTNSFNHFEASAPITPYEMTVEMLKSIYNYKSYYKKMIKLDEQNSLYDTIFQLTHQFNYQYLCDTLYPKVPDTELVHAISVYSYGNVYAMKQWILNNMQEAPETIADYIFASVPANLTTVFHR